MNPQNCLTSGPLAICRERFEVRINGATVILTLAEFRLLEALVRNAGQVIERSGLLAEIAPHHKIVERNIDVHIFSLRRKLGSVARRLRTVRGLGYKWDPATRVS